MSKDDILKKMKLTQKQFDDRVQKARDDFDKLTPDEQKQSLQANGKTALQIANSVGGTTTPADVEALFANVPASGGIYFLNCC